MPEAVFCHGCSATTTTEARYSNAGDRVCPQCESDFIELIEAPVPEEQPQRNATANNRHAARDRHNQGFHRHFTTLAGHNVHLHVVTSMGGLPPPLENLLNTAEPAQLTALLQNMQEGATFTPLGLPPGVSPGDYGPNGGAALDDLLMHLMEAHQPSASPTSRDTLASLPRRKVSSASAAGREVFSNTPNDLPAACGSGEPCSVCHDTFEEGAEVVELPCQHCYHEDCITAWLKDHNTCPVCRKELPVDEDLRREQQQARQARFQQHVQRQPAPLQSLFGALNPFHLLGRNRSNINGTPAAQGPAANNSNADAASPGNQPAPEPSSAALPADSSQRLNSVLVTLQDLEARLDGILSSGASRQGREVIEAQLADTRAQRAQLQASAQDAVQTLRTIADDHRIGEQAVAAALELAQDEPPSLVSTDGEDESDDPAADVAESDAELAAALIYSETADYEDSEDGNDSEDADQDDMPHLEDSSSDDDDLPDLIEVHSNEDAEATTGAGHVDPITASLVGSNDGLNMLQAAMLQMHGMPVGNQAGSNEDATADMPVTEDLPELEALGAVGFAENGPVFPLGQEQFPFSGHLDSATAAATGRHTPLELDQQAALDDLSNNIDDAAALARGITQELDLFEGPSAEAHGDSSRGDTQHPSQPEATNLASATAAEAATAAQEDSISTHAAADPGRRVAPRIHSQSTPQNPAALQVIPGLPSLAAADLEPPHVRLNALPVSQAMQAEAQDAADRASELHSHPLMPTPSRKRSFDPSEASTSLTDSPGAAAAAAAAAAVEQSPRQESEDISSESTRGSNQPRSSGLLAPVTWAARGAGRLVGSILRRSSSGRR